MKLIKTSLFTGFFTGLKVISGFVVNKMVAINLGPVGVSLLGSFLNFNLIISTFSNGAITNGIIKYTAEFKGNKFVLVKIINTSLRISIITAVCATMITLIFSNQISQLIFGTKDYFKAIIFCGLLLIFVSINLLITSYLNGFGNIKLITVINSSGSILLLTTSFIGLHYYKLKGVFIAVFITQFLLFIISLCLIYRKINVSRIFQLSKFDYRFAKKLSHFSLMAIVTACVQPISQIVIRNFISEEFSLKESGVWQGLIRLSDGYLLIITTTLNYYYLPKLSSLKDKREIKKEIFSGYKTIIPFLILSCFLIYILKHWLIRVFFTPDFESMSKLFFWQLIGDIFKIASFILAYLLIAKSMTKIYIYSEVIFNSLYVILTMLICHSFGIKSISFAFAINYFMYFVFLLILFRKTLFSYVK